MKNQTKPIGHHQLMNSMHLLDEGLALAADALYLNRFSDLPEGLQNHLAACQECRIAVMELFYMRESMEEGAQVELPPFFSIPGLPEAPRYVSSVHIWLKIAAVILLLIIPMAAVQFSEAIKSSKLIGQYFTGSAVTTPVDRFKPDPLMEPLAQMVLRGSDVLVLTPASGDTLAAGKPIHFQWIDPSLKSLTLRLQDNQGKLIANLVVNNESFLVESLLPGRYYWKLESNSKLLYFGSFIVVSD